MLYGEINRQRLKLINEHVVADTIDYLDARFAFSEDWDGLEKWVHFAKDGEVYDIRLTDDCIRKEDHLNLSAGIWKVYLHANEFSGGKVIERITTNAAILKVEPTGALNGEPFPEMPASVTEQILARLENVEQNGGGSGGQQAQIDDTLTKPGYAADAAKVGEKIGELHERLANFEQNGGGTSIEEIYILSEEETVDDAPDTVKEIIDPYDDSNPVDFGQFATKEDLRELSGKIADKADISSVPNKATVDGSTLKMQRKDGTETTADLFEVELPTGGNGGGAGSVDLTAETENLFDGHYWTYGVDIGTSSGSEHASTSAAVSDYIPASGGTTYAINIFSSDVKKQLYVFYFDSNKTYITSIGRVGIAKTSVLDTHFAYVTPDDPDIAYMRLRWYTSALNEDAVPTKTLLVEGGAALEPLNDEQFKDIEFSRYQKAKISALPLSNKRIANFGDSIAFGESGTNYAEQIAEKNYMWLDNNAVSGATIRVVDGSTNNVLAQIESYTPTVMPDFVLLEGLTNDASDTAIVTDALLGTVSDGFAAELDTSTFCGAFETLLKTAMIKYLGAKIIYITTHINYARDYETQKTLTELAIQICRKWGVAVADVFHESGLNSYITEHLTAYIDNGSHPNTHGYQTFYAPLIEGKMKG